MFVVHDGREIHKVQLIIIQWKLYLQQSKIAQLPVLYNIERLKSFVNFMLKELATMKNELA